jgi:hypothetical protein
MPLKIECPGCKAILQIADELAGRQGKCIHCGHVVTVPGVLKPIGPPLGEATPEAMVRELKRRNLSALLLLFRPSAEGSYDLVDLPDSNMKCIVTEDVGAKEFAELVPSIPKRFGTRRGAPVTRSAMQDEAYELKGDRLGMTLAEFKEKYARFTQDGRQDLPLCSDQSFGGRADLHAQAWHRPAGMVHARIDRPEEENSPTVAGVKTELLLYQFVDGLLYRISAFFPTDMFHVVSEALTQKYNLPSRETKQPRELIWENPTSLIVLARGTVHPRTASAMHLVHKELSAVAELRAPHGAEDI